MERTNINPTPYKISTITATGGGFSIIDLVKLFDGIECMDHTLMQEGILYVEYGEKRCVAASKGYHKKLKKRPIITKRFDNQMTMVMRVFDTQLDQLCDINCKVFRNGNIQMTGLKYINQGQNILNKLVELIPKHLLQNQALMDENNANNKMNYKIQLINCDFRVGCELRRDKICKYIQSFNDMFCNFEPCVYPGVKIQYFFNNSNKKEGVCSCTGKCNGKGKGLGEGDCKKITIAVFQSGCIIITGGQSIEQVDATYNFICNLIDNNFVLFKGVNRILAIGDNQDASTLVTA